MPRRARRDDVQSAAMDDASPTQVDAATDLTPQQGYLTPDETIAPTGDTDSTEGTVKPKARRNPRRSAAKQPADTENAGTADSSVTAGDLSNVGDVDTQKPRRSRRRPKVASVVVEDNSADIPESTEGVVAAEQPNEGTGRRRRVGGRRTPAELAAAKAAKLAGANQPKDVADSEDALTDASDSESDVSSTPARRSRRGGRRRRERGQQADPASSLPIEVVSLDVPSDDEEPDLNEASSVEDSTESDPSKSRRSRRGGRRRSKSSDTEESTSQASNEPTEDVYDFAMPVQRVRETWAAPLLVPDAAGMAIEAGALKIAASLDVETSSFKINDRSFRPHLFFVNADAAEGDQDVVTRQIKRAADTGIHLHTCVIYLPLKNAHGERSFAAIDSAISGILAADPEAYLVLRVQCVPTNFWVRTHTDQMAKYQDGSEGDVSIASNVFWTDAVDALQAMILRLTNSETPGHGRVAALHLDKGEWFYEPGVGYDYSSVNKLAFQYWLREHYQSEYTLRAAWLDGTVKFETAEIPAWEGTNKDKRADSVLYDRPRDRRYVDYLTYASEVVSKIVCGLATAVKAISANSLLVFVPYGYIFEFATRNDSGHQALGQVLRCKHIDVLTGPNSYATRGAGGVGGFCAPIDSVRLHNKLWIVEDDTKTYLAADDTPDSYNPKIPSLQETVMVLRRNYFAALTHGCGLAWMDLWGKGWFDSDELWEEIGDLLKIQQSIQENLSVTSPEAAVVVDEASYAWVRSEAGGQSVQSGLVTKARDLLLRSGASVGFYLQSDIDQLPVSVKVVFFMNALRVTTQERQIIREKLQRPGMTLVWMYGPGLYDENGVCPLEVTEIVGMAIRPQPWSARIGTIFTDQRHPVIERLHGGKRMGTEDVINPSFTVVDPQGTVLGEYAQSGDPSIVAKNIETGWKSVFVGEPHLTGELIRGIFRYAGTHLYDVNDDIVYARGEGFVLIHAPYTGQRIIHFPRLSCCYSIFDQRLIVERSSSLRVYMRGRSSHLLIWGDLEAISSRTGLSIDELRATLNYRPDQSRDQGSSNGGHQSDDNIDSSQTLQQAVFENTSQPIHEQTVIHNDEAPVSANAEVAGFSDYVGHGASDIAQTNALREASRITEQLLADITSETTELLDQGNLEGEETEEPELNSAPSELNEADGPQRRSRRRRWRRKSNPNAPRVEGAAPVSVDDLLSDLAARRDQGQRKPE